MNKLTLIIACVGFLTTQPAKGIELRGTATTVMSAGQAARLGEGVTQIPLYELLTLQVDHIDVPYADATSVVLNTWGRLQLSEDSLKDHDGDINLLYAQTRIGAVTLRLGRQHLAAGLGRMRTIDGGNITVRLPWGLLAEGFTGSVVRRRLNFTHAHLIAGGRVEKRLGLDGAVAINFRHERDRGSLAHEELGVDGWYVYGPARIYTAASMSPREKRLQEARLAVAWSGFEQWELTLDVERVTTDLFIPRTSLFSVFSNSTHDAMGGDVLWEPSPYYEVKLRAHVLLQRNHYLGHRFDVRATTYREAAHRSRVGAAFRRVYEDNKAFSRGRIFTGLQLTRSLQMVADAYAYYYDVPLNGIRFALLLQTSAVWDIASSMRLAATVATGSTPYRKAQVQGTLRFVYGYEVDLSPGAKP